MKRAWLGLVALIVLSAPAGTQTASVTINVDANSNRHPINPQIYGVAFGTSAELSDLNCPLNRSGGNSTTRYNWNLNASNRGSDWYFESIGESSATPGEFGDTFISDTRAGGAQPMITIPMIGWVAKLGANRAKLASFSIAKYGAQTDADWQWFADAGNGVLTSGANVSNDPNDANLPADSSFQSGWVQHLVGRWGTAANGGLRYYVLDNEHSIWQGTHRDVHPIGPHMEEIRDKMLQYSSMIKGLDPSAKVVGPEEWGWSGYLLSGYDQQWGGQHGWSNLPDKTSHGNMDYLPWLLDQLRQNEGTQRAIDVFTVHYYPQGGEFGNDVSSTMQLRRNRSTRSLWDPSYVDETWISDTVKLVPRLRSWTNTYYHSDTPIGITEYNWGAEGHINGATTQADIFGIFGREGLDLATRWTTPASTTPTYLAMKMYRNYDGAKSTFGDTSVAATGGNPDQLSAFAAVRSSDNALTVMVINKALSGSTPVTINVSNFAAGSSAKAWQLTSTNAIQPLSALTVTAGQLNATVPPQSVTLFVLTSAGGTATPTATARPTAAATPTLRPTATATARPTATATARPTATATATTRPTASATVTLGPTATVTQTASATATARPTVTATSTPRPTSTATSTAQPTSTLTPTARPAASPTSTTRPTSSATATARPTATPTPTARPTARPSATATPSPTARTTPPPRVLALSRNTLHIGVARKSAGADTTPTQTVAVTSSGAWTATSNQSFITVSPASAPGSAFLSVTVANISQLPTSGTVTATITVAAPGMTGSPQTIRVDVTVYGPGTTGKPFGSFDTPQNGAVSVQGALAVTGWALDDIGVARVEIYRDLVPGDSAPAANGKIFIGNATFVSGARPDVEAAFPTTPMNDRGGWGYMLCTNLLPDLAAHTTVGGNGTFTLWANVVDNEGQAQMLGARTVTIDNAHAVKPFGTIDTPAQGETVSGTINNFGWVLTPLPGIVPTNGLTITLYIDGAPRGTALYNLPRSDIQTLFPGYQNTGGPVGLFTIDTTALTNGWHTIAWSVTDNMGRAEGIGSRYFAVLN